MIELLAGAGGPSVAFNSAISRVSSVETISP
jgi:hypothetical protein